MNRKWMAGALAACLVLGSTTIALADSGKSAGKAPAKASQSQVTTKTHGTDRKAQVAELRQELAKLRDLQRQSNDLRHQLNGQWSTLRREIGQAMDLGQVDLLKAELPQLQAVHSDLKAAVEQQQQEKNETAGFASAKKGGDVSGALARIQAAEARVQARIDAEQKAIDEMKTLSADIEAKIAALPAKTVTGSVYGDDDATSTVTP